MGIDIIFKIASVGVMTAIINHILVHAGKPEIATLTNLAGVVIVLAMIISMIGELFDSVKNILDVF